MNNVNETKELQEFFYDGRQVRTVQIDGETWWVLKDVCDALGLTTVARVAERLDRDEVTLTHFVDSRGRNQETLIVNESGLYKVIFRSDKPNAKPFTRWVTHEVLPQIRKTGSYSVNQLSDEERLQDLLALDGNIVIAYGQKLKQAAELQSKVFLLENKIESYKPKIIFADAVSVSESSVLIGELAKILRGNGIEVGQNRLFERLRQSGFLVKRKGSDFNTPTQKSMELGLFRIIETAITHSDGRITVSKTTKVTGKGQQYFANYFLNEDSKDRQIHEAFSENDDEDNATITGEDHDL